MNKKLKIATAAVSVVMAGTMVVGMFGCTPKKPVSEQEKYEVAAAGTDISGVTININIGDAAQRSISFGYGELLSGTVKLPDGKSYSSSSLKPAWAAFETMVGCKFKDVWQNASKKLTNAATATTEGARLSDMDIITDGAANVATNKASLLDLSNYLDEMPNYKKFLDDNPIVRLSLTSDTEHGSMYYAPYFDGNNDIEKYELFKTNWLTTLLDTDEGDTTTTYASHGTTKKGNGGDYANTLTTETAITSFMGTTGSWTAEVLDKDGKKLDAGITVNYDKVLAAAKSADGLGAAVTAAAGATYTGDSGNIVDIMNYVINTKEGNVTGAQLKKILQEYIKVAYYVGGTETSFYTQAGYKLSDVFAGYSAAWDVDLYAAIGRVLVTNPAILNSGKTGHIGDTDSTPLSNLYLLSARQNNMQRMIDTVSMIGQLYGVRGLESKNLYSYVGSDGRLKDPRGDAKSYEAMEKFNAFWKEGLIYTGASGSNADQSYYKSNTPEALSCYDYVNTQTPVGFEIQGATGNWQGPKQTYTAEADYNYTPIITPVSKWNDGKEQVMRFTESWRTTKDTGFCVPVANVKDNPTKLRAVLTFIDKMFSNDGQILLTYGPKATSATAGDGFWYNEEATAEQIAAGTYFEYDGKKLYSTIEYGGVYQPQILENVYNAYYGKSTTENVKFDGTGLTYAGGDTVIAPESALTDGKLGDDYKVKNGATLSYDVYCVDSKGKFVKVAAGAKMGGDLYVVEATVAANTEVTGAAHYIVDVNGKLAASDGKRVALISDTVSQWTTNATLNYTNFARYVIGSALPIGNKLQSFEFQLTSTMGRKGALIVDAGLGLLGDPTDGVIKHTVNVMTSNPWYTVVPTLLPYSEADTDSLSGTHNRLYTGDEGNYFSNNKNDNTNLYWQIIKYGMDAGQITAKYAGLGLGNTGTVTAQQIMQKLEDVDGYTAYVNIKNKAWQASKKFYDIIKK